MEIYAILHASIYVLRLLRRIDGNKLFFSPWNFLCLTQAICALAF